MPFGLKYEDLIAVANTLRAGIVQFDPNNEEHETLLKAAIPQFLGSLGAVHGEEFPIENLEAVLRIAKAKDVEFEFLVAAHDACSPIKIIGLATTVQTFGAEWDENHKLRIVPIHHGEDLVIDEEEAKLFRKLSKTEKLPDGTGAGTFFVRAQILRSLANPHWRFAGRDNEHREDNYPVVYLMNKYGAVPAAEWNSSVLETHGLPTEMQKRWGVNNVIKEDLSGDALGLTKDPNSFLTHWSSEDGKQQIVVVFKKMASTFNGQPVVWARLQSHGRILDAEMRKEIETSLFRTAYEEMASPERLWGIPRGTPINPLNHEFGAPVPILHLHMNNEPEIMQDLLEMGWQYRKFGPGNMVSGHMPYSNIRNQVETLGLIVPKATKVKAFSTSQEYDGPYHSVVDNEDARQISGKKKQTLLTLAH